MSTENSLKMLFVETACNIHTLHAMHSGRDIFYGHMECRRIDIIYNQ